MSLLQAIQEHVERVASWNPAAAAPSAEFSYIDLSSVDQEQKVITEARKVVGADAPSRARQLVKAGDVLVSTVRPNLNGVARVPDALDRATASTGFTVLRANERTLSGAYLLHWVKTPQFVDDMVRKATGASYPAVSDRIVCDSKIPLPPMEEQRRIAAILDQAEALRAKRRQALAKLDTLTQSLFLEMFGDPLRNPKRWETATIGELIIDGPQNGLYKPATDYGSGTPILRIDAFYDGEVKDFSALKRVRLAEREIESYLLHENDIVVNRVNSREYLGKSALITGLPERTVFESNMMRFRVDRQRIDTHFLIAMLQTHYIKSQILQRCKDAVNQSSINQDDVKSFVLPLPSLDLQEQFAGRMRAIKDQLRFMGLAQDRAAELRSSLQARAFRGEL